jgi:hypothetical protein
MHSEGLAGKTETFVRYGLTQRLEAGFGYLWKQGIVRPLASYTLVTEKGHRPSLTGGLMYDSLGGGRQGVFISVAKGFARTPLGVPASLYVGGAKISGESGARFIAGLNVPLNERVTASVQYDGRYPNFGVTAHVATVGGAPIRLGVVAAEGDKFGLLIATSIPLGR